MAIVASVIFIAAASPVLGQEVAPVAGTRDELALLADLINEERGNSGLVRLTVDPLLQQEADAHSLLQADAGEIFHNDVLFTAEGRSRLAARVLGENVASNSSLEDAHRRLMNSDGHRANILDRRFTRVGIGLRKVTGTWYVTEVFADQQAAPAPAPSAAPPVSIPPTPLASPPAEGVGAAGEGAVATAIEVRLEVPVAPPSLDDPTTAVTSTPSSRPTMTLVRVPDRMRSALWVFAVGLLLMTACGAGRRVRLA